MADPSAGSASTTTPSGRTPEYVIQMFAALQLPVCDDGDAIDKQFEAKKARYLRDKNGTDRDRAAVANTWFRNCADLKQRRRDLIDLVYKKFCLQADISLKGSISAGLKTLTEPLLEGMRAILRDSCRVDDELAGEFLEKYLNERGLEKGREIVNPALILNFVATSRIGKISLTWQVPPQKCDQIVIVRESEENKEVERTFENNATKYEDGSVEAGTWYTYRAYSIYQGVKSTGFVEARGICIGEVAKAMATWKSGQVRVSWEPPGAKTQVWIFRGEGAPPSVAIEQDRFSPGNDRTIQVYRGGGNCLTDNKAAEGVTYFYRIIADFGEDRFSHGAEVQLTTPKPPPPPAWAKARYQQNAKKNVVALEWNPAPHGTAAEYAVVRREGDAPAGRVEDGVLVAQLAQTRCLDEDEKIVAGRRYTYAVFTQTGELYSRTAAVAGPIDITADVSDLVVKTGDRTIELEWSTPPNVHEVRVRRSLAPPRDVSDGAPVNLTGAGHAKDEKLKNGQRYHYLVSCIYRHGAADVISSGRRIEGIPVLLPDPIQGFAAKAKDREIECAWSPPAHGQAVVIRSEKPHGLLAGVRLKTNEIDGMGERILAAESGRATDANPDISKPYYAIFTVEGEHAVAGGTAACVSCPDVTDLALSATRDGIILRWRWPDKCTAVRVARRQDCPPESPEDPNAVTLACMKTEYDSAGGRFTDSILEGGGRFYYVVYAQAAGAPGQFFSSGKGSGCREAIDWQPLWTTIRYRISPCPGKAQKGQYIHLSWTVEECAPNFSGFVLIASQDRIPEAPDDGIELFRWKPEPDAAIGDHEADISLDPVHRRRWVHFYAKILTIEPAQRFTTLIIHPNVCVPILEEGTLQYTVCGAVRSYKRGVPKRIVCPWCFSEFPVGEMLFTSFGGGEMIHGKHSWIDRIQNRPPKPPIDSQGRKLTNKVCPKCQRQLPYTAGGQASLVIGLIGAKYVGKSHYIAALIDRLGNQVGNDLQAALIPVSDETTERYQREFYDPLFKNRLELPMTVGTPPPLIYDLRFSGSLWKEEEFRSVTLALYDTAGENFDKAEKVREMVNYLRHASGVILLVDPLQVNAVREALPGTVRLPDVDAMADPNLVVSRVYQELENGKVVAENSPLKIPVALVLTKCDVLRDAGLVDQNRLWSSSRRHQGYFDREAHDDMVGMFGECVRRWSPAVFNNVTQRFSRHAFFGVSSTGCASDKKTLRFKYISPWRVEDPLLWLLAELGVIPSR